MSYIRRVINIDKLIVDFHCDTIKCIYDDNGDLKNKKYVFNLQNAGESAPYIQFMACFIHPKYVEQRQCFERANKIIDKYYSQCEKYANEIVKVNEKEDLLKIINENKVGTVLAIENASAIEGKIENIEYFYNKGVKCMSLVWNEDNDLSCGALTKNDTGLTTLGKMAIKEMNKLNMQIDVSHISEKGFYDICKITDNPIIATHSCVKKICNHPRNLSDEQIKEIARQGGIIGVCFSSSFLNETGIATSKDIAYHIDYIANLVGIEHVALGSDFDGLSREHYPLDVKGVKDICKILNELKNLGYSEEDICKVAGQNANRAIDIIFKT